MGKENVTLKKIAEEVGVSITTVHRALGNKEGCSEALRERILAAAKEQGYAVNYVASSLRQRTLYIALVFPGRTPSSRYYLQRMLDGYLKYREEISQFNIVFQEYYYQNEKELEKILENIYRERPVKFDGIVSYGILPCGNTVNLLNCIIGSKTPVVMLEKVPPALVGASCVGVDERMAGSMAGELLKKGIHHPGRVAILTQEMPGSDQNGEACRQELLRRREDIEPVVIALPIGDELQTEAIQEKLNAIDNLVGAYMTCARHTAAFLAVQPQLPQVDAVIGSELFAETMEALNEERMDAVIDKNPRNIGYYALSNLFSCVVKKEPLPERHNIVPRIVLRANCAAYEDY